MDNNQEKHVKSSSNPDITLTNNSNLIKTFNETKYSNKTSRTNSITNSKIKKQMFKTSNFFFHRNCNSNSKTNSKNTPVKLNSSLPLIFKKLNYNEIKQKLFQDEYNLSKQNQLKNSTDRLFEHKSKNNINNDNPKKIFGKTFYKENMFYNSRYGNSNDNPLSNSYNFNKDYIRSFSLIHSHNNKNNNNMRRTQSLQDNITNNRQNKKKKTLISIQNIKKLVKIKNIVSNETIKHSSANSLSDRRTHQKYPVKLKEKEILKKYAYKSQPGKNEGNVPKINQDTYLIKYKINGIKDFNMFGILDGHGCNGHLVSKFISEFIYINISHHNEIKQLSTPYEIYLKLKENNYQIIKQIYYKAEAALHTCEFECDFSGCTCNIIFQLGYNIICSNVGDSRAVMVSKSNEINSKYEYLHLSIDHKPTLPNEKKRIIKKGGKIEQYVEYGVKKGPYRVWVKGEDFPGLAVSRSIGDLIASKIGVIPEPEITERYIMGSTKYILIASDGVWEYLDSESVMQMTIPFYDNLDGEGMCDCVIENAVKYWTREEKVIDDISVIVILF